MSGDDTLIREATEQDVPGILRVFTQTYGHDYPYANFFDADWLKQAIFNDHMLMLVAEDVESGQVYGTASVVFDIGADAFGDLVLAEA